jgi:subtilase family serine protease
MRSGGVATLLALACGLASSAWAEAPSRMLGRAVPTQTVAFDVYLHLRNGAELDTLLDEQQLPGSPQFHRWLTPSQFRARFGADPAEIARVTAELRAAGLAAAVNGSHSLHVTGSAAAVERAFATRLARARFAEGSERMVAEVTPTLPPALAAAGAVVAQFAPANHMRRHSHAIARNIPYNRSSTTGFYWFDDLKQAYRFPSFSFATGKGVNIGILMSGDYDPSDMKLYFGHEKLAVPHITSVPIYGGAPFSTSTSDETSLDIQQNGGMAPEANITLFNLPDLSDAGVLAGLTTVVENNATDVVGMSFGSPELAYAPAYNSGVDYTGILLVYNDMFRQGSAQGISFVASSGDLGAYGVPKPACFDSNATSACGGYSLSVENPASSPYVTAVGGTNLVTAHVAGSLTSAYVSENAAPDSLTQDIFYSTPAVGGLWGSGGGISTVFAQPSFQTGVSTLSTTHRIVPDVALHMGGCPDGAKTPCGPDRSGDIAVVGGQLVVLVGTSASAQDFTGLLALKVQVWGGRLGNANPNLYALAKAQAHGGAKVFHTGIAGNNGHYTVTAGYNAVLGNGTPYANVFLGAAGLPVAGVPQTPSNP